MNYPITLQGKNSFGKVVCAVNIPANDDIWVRFTDGVEANYTMEIFSQLITDPSVDMIFSATTGEVLYY